MCDWKQQQGAQCPLCRSEISTGLTPVAPAPTAGAPTGFVSSSDLYATMMRRRADAASAQATSDAAMTDSLLSPGVDGAFQELVQGALSQQQPPPDCPEYW